ncbi:GNAT family N-acetyltransferase [Sphingorhabdus sp. EL138]|uniref:GNAT family N-acetyltransferase n=1 Tax=Sphingorhabdus sp. EL138 TaxID=2073156 RepID=UPI000D69D0B3|nr:GNAT family N-acetyltransferase [Sphingorhabdus sp. EL138]
MDAGGFQTQNDEAVHFETADRVCLTSSASTELVSIATIDERLLNSWQKLARNAAEPNSFYEPWLLGPAVQHFNTHPELSLFLFWAGLPHKSDLLGLLPVGPCRQLGRWPVPFVQNWTHHNSFLGTPLVRSGFENQFWTALFKDLDDKNWPGFLHIRDLTVGGPLDQALRAVCARQQRRCDLVHSEARAFLKSDLEAETYYTETVRSKKRKELRRQAKRLSEMGDLSFTHHADDAGLEIWIADFLKLERESWKGQEGSALDCSDDTRGFFTDTLTGAASAGQLERHDLRLNGKPLAMLVNFCSAPGSFSFKTAFDDAYARFSPGVLLQRENLNILERPDIDWMDSCAAQDHPMIDSLWSGRRHIGRFSIELKGLSRNAIFRGVRFGEDLMAQIKGREIVDIMQVQQ